MNERHDHFNIKCKNICVACLKTTDQIFTMSFELRNEYIKFVEGVKEEAEIMICSICSWIFQRFLKFKQQCQVARTVLKDAALKDVKPLQFLEKLKYCFNFSTTIPEVHYYYQNNTFESEIETLNNTQENTVNYTQNTVNNTQITVKNSQIAVNNTQNTVNNTLDDEDMHDDGIFDNTELHIEDPLLLRNGKGRKKSRRKMVHSDDTKSEPVTKDDLSRSKNAKVLKDGFSSRMVQETNEYTVIKLTKEQVLQEMQERSKTDAYAQSPYKCEDCVKGFNFHDVLQTHKEKHTMENGSFQCDMCFQYCRSAVSLRGHIKSHTTRYKCKLCFVVRLSRQHLLEHHAITHTRQPVTYSCDTCQFNTNKRTVMQRHVKSHASTEPHACEKCGKLFKSIDSLRVHTIRHDKSSRLQCVQCDVSFVYGSLLRRHVARVHDAKEYYCVECDTHYNSRESLRLHFKKAKRHRDSSTYKHTCSECGQRFFTSSSLAAHRGASHAASKTHSCPHCRRLYASRDALRAHVWRVHTDRTIKES